MPTTAPGHKTKRVKPAKSSAKRNNAPQESTNVASPMNTERLRRLYSTMLKCRLAAERCAAVFGSNSSADFAATGYEAVEVGACIHLREEDLVSPTSSLIHGSLSRGTPIATLFNLLKPGMEGTGSLSCLEVSAAAQIQSSTLVALSHKLARKPIVNLAVIGTSTSSKQQVSPDFWESSVQFAGARKLGIVYMICTTADSTQDLRGRALDFQVPGIIVDGNDVVAVYRVAEESVRRAREGHGPTLIDCKIDPARDPLAFMESYLKKRDLWSDKWHAKTMHELKQEIDKANL